MTTHGQPVPDGPPAAQARLQHLPHEAVIEEAELAAHGVGVLTVAHGDPEDAEDMNRLRQLWQWAPADGRSMVRRGANDSTTWLLPPPDADDALNDLERLAYALDPGWWRIRRSPW